MHSEVKNKFTPEIHNSHYYRFVREAIRLVTSQEDSRPARFNKLYDAFIKVVVYSHVQPIDSDIRKFADSLAAHNAEAVNDIVLLIEDREKMSLASLKELVYRFNPDFARTSTEEQEIKTRFESLMKRAEELIDEDEYNEGKAGEFLKEIAKNEKQADAVLDYLARVGEGILFNTFTHLCFDAIKNRPQKNRTTDTTQVVLPDSNDAKTALGMASV